MAKLARRRKLQKAKERAAKMALRQKVEKIKKQIESKNSIAKLIMNLFKKDQTLKII